jgi:hypothetical protein
MFTCEMCGKEFEVHTAVGHGTAYGGHTAKCPSCGKARGGLPEKVLRVAPLEK